jgi:hypothetical protein
MRAATGGAAIAGAIAGGLLAGPLGMGGTLFLGAGGIVVALIWMVASPLRSLRELPPPAA